MIKVLWIALCAPYDRVPHAGGQNFNYYLKRLNNEKNIKIKLITFCKKNEFDKLDMKDYHIDSNVFCEEKEKTFLGVMMNNYIMRFNPFNKYANFLDKYTENRTLNECKKLKESDYMPDVIILHWTQMILMAKHIKKIYPNSRIIAIEEDVALLGLERKLKYINNQIKKLLYKYKYNILKQKELKALSQVDTIYVTNKKDKKILEEFGIQKRICVLNSFFHNMVDSPREYDGQKHVIFYGAMNRIENYLSAKWFAESVMPLLDDTFIFDIIGNNPPLELKKLECKNINIVGFVESIEPFFKTALCMVAPLVLGAGIKMKVIEALSAGIPVLTNEIGAEGIDIISEEEYVFCKEPIDYVNAIRRLEEDQVIMHKLEKKEKRFISTKFSYELTYQFFCKDIKSIKGREPFD